MPCGAQKGEELVISDYPGGGRERSKVYCTLLYLSMSLWKRAVAYDELVGFNLT